LTQNSIDFEFHNCNYIMKRKVVAFTTL